MDSNTADLADRVRELTDGVGVDVVYDGVGRATFESSLAALRPRGLLALFGAASGVVPPFELDKALAAGSLYVTRPSLFHHIAERRELVERATEVLQMALDGSLTVHIGGRYPFTEAKKAYETLEGRRSLGKLLLTP